ncbi:DJ-1/PfpI family protein [Aquimarina gracilis]|uniref:DJ-1/PfpI family protein n=1 Tax=Aquimarina gracilis TaxID=874422 RepID=A0ABU5ZYZ7_9FLAO|nr:DJ-1/PfpI family protein [Aquimarina gracilis]MEB3347091.1 DJ-1/PfpI family protein [Aquimarina gracilis]
MDKLTYAILIILLHVFSFSIKAQNDLVISDENVYVCPPCNRKCDDLEFAQRGICQHCNMKLIEKKDLENYPEVGRKKIGFYLQSGVEILDLAGPMEVFNYAGYEVFTISKTKDPIYAQGILKVIPDYDILDAPEAEILVFFGGNAILPSKDKELIDWLKSQKPKYYFSVCSGALILAESGILDGKQATTFRYTLEILEDEYPKIAVLKGARYVDNGNIITTAGVSAGIDGALHVVAKLNGLAVAAQTAFYMEYDWIPNQVVAYPEDDPYIAMNITETLKQYEGTFYSEEKIDLHVILNKKEKQLYLNSDEKKIKIYYIEKDKFLMSHPSHMLEFTRDQTGKIISLKSTEYAKEFKKK